MARSDEAPPAGNYGGFPYTLDGQLTEHQSQTSDLAARPGSILLDYLRAVIPDDPDNMRQLSGWLGAMTPRPFGWRGWYDRSMAVLDGGIVAWCSDRQRAEREGVLIDLPGRACACLGARLVPFLQWCLAMGHVSRADFAIDDRAGRLTWERLEECHRGGGVVTRWSRYKPLPEYTSDGRRRLGWTVYLGKRGGQAMLRIYDKAAEQARKARSYRERDAKMLAFGQWVRVELECKGAFADALARAYFAEGSAAVIGQIARRVRFAMPASDDSNRARWITAPWWAELLGSVKPGPSLLAGEKPTATIENMKAWIELQAGPTLATCLEADGGDLAWLAEMAARSHARMKSKHLAALAMADDREVPS